MIHCGRGATRRDRLNWAPEQGDRRAQRASHKRNKQDGPIGIRTTEMTPTKRSWLSALTRLSQSANVVQFKYDLICTPFVIHYLQMREMIYEQKRNAKGET